MGVSISVDAAAPATLDVPAVSPSPSGVDAVAAPESSVEAVAPSTANVDAAAVSEADIEFLAGIIMGLSPEQLAKLNSIAWGADRSPRDYRKKVDLTGKSTLGGNSVVWTGSNTGQPVCRWMMNANEWRESGVIEIDLTGTLLNDGAAAFYTVFALSVADAPPTTDDTAAVSFGVPSAFNLQLSYFTPSFTNTVAQGTVKWRLRMELHAEGHQSTTWGQTAHTLFTVGSRPPLSPRSENPVGAIDDLTIDPTKDQWFQLSFATGTAMGADQAFKVLSARVGLRNARDGY